jgi:hypothetical protein
MDGKREREGGEGEVLSEQGQRKVLIVLKGSERCWEPSCITSSILTAISTIPLPTSCVNWDLVANLNVLLSINSESTYDL